jgi:uncharacterized protein YuzE
MRITYDPRADALYISFREERPSDSLDVEEGVTVDLDDDGHILGLEVLDARVRFGDSALESVTVERLPASLEEIVPMEQPTATP